MNRFPNFLGIGAQKSGTTWLHNMLTQHPDIFMPQRKELMFFDVKSNFESEGLDGYAKHFEAAEEHQQIGEVTPGYLWTATEDSVQKENPAASFRRKTPGRVADILGRDTKLLVILRNPVDRAISAFFHHFRKGRLTKIDEKTLDADPYGIIDMGHYVRHLDRWMEHFPRQNFYVTTYEELFADAELALERIYGFLGVTTDLEHKKITKRFNKPSEYELRGDGYWLTASEEFEVPTNEPVIPISVVDQLERAFDDSNARLAESWGIDVSVWSGN